VKVEVATAIEDLKRQFGDAKMTVRDDGQGGAYVVLDGVRMSEKFRPFETWLGFHIPAQYPYADIYPVFIGANIARANGAPFQAPVTAGHHFEGRPALQISRRSPAAQNGSQKAVAKILKVLDFLERLQ